MKKRIKKQQSINGRVLGILFLTFLPVLAILYMITWNMFHYMSEQVVDANLNEMKIFMSEFDNDVSTATEQMKQIAIDYRTKFYPLKDPGVIKYNIWNRVNQERNRYSIIDIGFIRDGASIDFAYDTTSFQPEEISALETIISEQDSKQWDNFSYHLLDVKGKKYMILYAYAGSFEYGYLVDLEKSMQLFQNQNGNKIINDIVENEADKANTRVLTVRSSETGCYLVRNISNALIFQAVPLGRKLSVLLAAMCMVLFPIQWYSLKKYVIQPLGRISSAMKELEQEHLEYRMEGDEKTLEFVHIEQGFNDMAEQIKNLRIESYEKDIERLRIENLNLRLQVNPHMLLNSLNMIYSLSKSHNSQGVEDMTMCLSKYFRYVLYNNREFSKIKDEMEFISSYMEIQKIRFPGAFSYVYDVDEAIFDEEIPTMLIQNFVENSIKYALNMETVVDIMVLVKKIDDRLSISIIDTGNGMDEEILEKVRADEAFVDYRGTHIGIWNCRKRLQIHYGDQTKFSISSKKGEGTQVWMEIPRIERRESDEPFDR
ncbi:sensor histidine kinase [Anaerobium acetethylicum]|uniref:histidine kinase n=1 Tax=Anaerobium acetethylicum TaxID=1619234 RepID=A0A1D3TYH2_9FIRM|nr:histidine kinase [Anaerobium acetethylicum]SCP99516.1 Histidine kinase-, DNA gyrase B-, and HSP90-like ATPase [Anaerobium acetethylicum]